MTYDVDNRMDTYTQTENNKTKHKVIYIMAMVKEYKRLKEIIL